MPPRVMLIGLDCVPPALAFGSLAAVMPCLSSLRARGAWGALRSVVPPITVPAWASMTSGCDPGALGVYGFRDRAVGSYALTLNDARTIDVPRLWDLAVDAGLTACALFVPPSWPPPPAREGLSVVSCLLSPGDDRPWASPPALEAELRARFGPYVPDVADVRTRDVLDVIAALSRMTQQHFAIARHLLETRAPDFFAMVEIGPDRLHHAAWQHLDATHPAHDPAHPAVAAARDYYALVDRELASLCALAGAETTVVVASDHGARTMQGGVRINEWLAREGWLVLRERPATPVPLAEVDVDWARTRAWSDGGYHARVFLNVRGREPRGAIAESDVATTREELAGALRAMTDDAGAPLGNVVLSSHDLYPSARRQPPDLTVLLGDLAYRALGTIGGPAPTSMIAREDDRGRDGANHDHLGIVVLAGGGVSSRGEIRDAQLYDVFATMCSLLSLRAPAATRGLDLSR